MRGLGYGHGLAAVAVDAKAQSHHAALLHGGHQLHQDGIAKTQRLEVVGLGVDQRRRPGLVNQGFVERALVLT